MKKVCLLVWLFVCPPVSFSQTDGDFSLEGLIIRCLDSLDKDTILLFLEEDHYPGLPFNESFYDYINDCYLYYSKPVPIVYVFATRDGSGNVLIFDYGYLLPAEFYFLTMEGVLDIHCLISHDGHSVYWIYRTEVVDQGNLPPQLRVDSKGSFYLQYGDRKVSLNRTSDMEAGYASSALVWNYPSLFLWRKFDIRKAEDRDCLHFLLNLPVGYKIYNVDDAGVETEVFKRKYTLGRLQEYMCRLYFFWENNYSALSK